MPEREARQRLGRVAEYLRAQPCSQHTMTAKTSQFPLIQCSSAGGTSRHDSSRAFAPQSVSCQANISGQYDPETCVHAAEGGAGTSGPDA